MMTSRIILRFLIYSLLLLTFFLGLPQLHYASALMIAILIRHKDEPQGVFGPVNSTEIRLPAFKQGPKAIYDSTLPKAPVSHELANKQVEHQRPL